MKVGELLGVIREQKIELVVDGDRLRCIAAPGVLTPDLAAQIRAAKAELLTLLADVSRKSGAGSAIPRTVAKGHFPLSFTQRRAVITGRISSAVPTAFLLRGALDVSALTESLRWIVARHMPLRTRFLLDGENAEQEVLADVPLALPTTDLTGYSDDERPQRLRELLADLSHVEFDIRQPPLFRFTLVRVSPEVYVLHTAFNVLIFDGWSFDVFWQEMRGGYAAITQGEPWPPAPLPISYEDFVAWQRKRVTQEIADQATFWKTALGQELPPLPLPTDRPRPRVAVALGKGIPFEIPVEAADAIRRFAKQASVTPQITLLASLYALLARMGTTRDIVIASPVDARTQPSLEGLIGPVVNILLLRTHVDLDRTFAEFAVSLRDFCLSAYEHQEYPLERLDVRSAPSDAGGFAPAFQIEFSFQQVSQRGSHMGNLSLSQLELESGAATNDITLWVKDWGERIAGAVEFKTELFDEETIEHWASCYKNLVRELVRNPTQPMREVDLLGGERERILARFAQVSAAPPAWVAKYLSGGASAHPLSLRVVDEENQPRPFGIPGHLVVERNGSPDRLTVQARCHHDGSLVEVPAAAAARAKADPIKPGGKRTELEMRICLLFEELLGLSAVGAEQDYFELGGNSLIAVRLFGAIQEQYGVRLPMATILDASTPRQLARAIKQKVHSRESCVVRLKEGGQGPALFLIHDGDGETLLYRNLALRMPKHVSVYGIEPFAVDKVAMAHTSIAEMAGHYVKEIRKLQPAGPYHLGGLCAGGLIAFEVARQLEGYGEEIRHLAIIEASPPQAQKRTTARMRSWQRFSGVFRDVSLATAGATVRKGVEKLTGYLGYEVEHRYRQARVRSLLFLLRHVFPGGKNWPRAVAAPTVREVFAFAESEYVPAKLQRTQAVIYRATEGKGSDAPLVEILADPFFGWQDYLGYQAEVVDVPGGHGTLLREPYVASVASRMRASFDSSNSEPKDAA